MQPNRAQSELPRKPSCISPAQEATLSIWQTSDQFHNRFGRLLRKYGLTPSQYNVLRILREEDGPLASLEIAERMVQVVPAITGLIDRLEQQRFVRRQRSTNDRRIVHVRLTEIGRKMLVDLDQPVIDLHRKLLEHLSPSEIEQVTRLMAKAREGSTPS